MERKPIFQRSKGSKVIQVIHTKILEGDGTNENICRVVDYFYHLDGTLLARYDSWEAQKRGETENGD